MAGDREMPRMVRRERRNLEPGIFLVHINRNSMASIPQEAAQSLFRRRHNGHRRVQDKGNRWYARVFPITEFGKRLGVSFSTERRPTLHYAAVIFRRDEPAISPAQFSVRRVLSDFAITMGYPDGRALLVDGLAGIPLRMTKNHYWGSDTAEWHIELGPALDLMLYQRRTTV